MSLCPLLNAMIIASVVLFVVAATHNISRFLKISVRGNFCWKNCLGHTLYWGCIMSPTKSTPKRGKQEHAPLRVRRLRDD